MIKTIKINKIRKAHYKGPVYNLELKSRTSNDRLDDLFWIEQETGIVSHNCFSKDINALINSFEEENIKPRILKAAWELNLEVRKNWDWASNPSAVLEK